MDDFLKACIIAGLCFTCIVVGASMGWSNANKAMVHRPALVVTDEGGKRTVMVNGVVVTAEDAARLVEFWQKAAVAAEEKQQ